MALNGDALGDQITADQRAGGYLRGSTEEELDAAEEQVRAGNRLIGNTIVDYLKANGEITVTIGPSNIALQTSTSPGSPTGAPAVERTLSGEIE